MAIKFITEFKEKLIENKVNKRLIRMIEDKTSVFGPKRKGPNILINKFLRTEDSFFHKILKFKTQEENKNPIPLSKDE